MQFSIRHLLILTALCGVVAAIVLAWPNRRRTLPTKCVLFVIRSAATGSDIVEATFHHSDGSTTRIIDHAPFGSSDLISNPQRNLRLQVAISDSDKLRSLNEVYAVILTRAKSRGLLTRPGVKISDGEQLDGTGVVVEVETGEDLAIQAEVARLGAADR